MKNKKRKEKKELTIRVVNPPTKEEAKKMVEHISEFIKLKYYS